ncbi:MAG: hypothetical protein HYS55_01510, partial [Candidatus Omnitrophica bacterium]|nr:hypothetical protein [Candidatus Omnitrophota bacterium]
ELRQADRLGTASASRPIVAKSELREQILVPRIDVPKTEPSVLGHQASAESEQRTTGISVRKVQVGEKLTLEHGRFNPEAIFADTTPVTPVPSHLENEALARSKELGSAIKRPTLFVQLSNEDDVASLVDSGLSDAETKKTLEALFGLAQLGSQGVTVLVPSEESVRPFNQLLAGYRSQLRLQLPPGVQIKASYTSNQATLVRHIGQVRVGEVFLVTSLSHALGVAGKLPSDAYAVVGDQFANKAHHATTPRHQFEMAAALLLFPEAFRPNGIGDNILFGEQSVVEKLAGKLYQIIQANLKFWTSV